MHWGKRMARRKVTFVQGVYYHVYNRGADRQPIFRSDENYRFLLKRVKKYAGSVSTWGQTVGA
jgi:hypothetical protein